MEEIKISLNEEEIENVKFALEKMSEYRDCPGFLFSETMKDILLKIDIAKQVKEEAKIRFNNYLKKCR